MIRGTTPKHIFALPFSTELIKEARVVYSQSGKRVLIKKTTDCECTENQITVCLSQEDTFKFDCTLRVDIQVRILTHSGDVLASNVQNISVARCLDDEVLV